MCGCETGCAGYPPLDLGSEKAPPDEAHTRSRFSLDLYSRACAPGNVFRHGHGHIREALTSPLGSSPSSGRARSSSHLQTAVLGHGRNTQRRGASSARRASYSDYLRHAQRHTTYTQRRPYFYTPATTGSKPEHGLRIKARTGPQDLRFGLDGGNTMQEMLASPGWRSGAF